VSNSTMMNVRTLTHLCILTLVSQCERCLYNVPRIHSYVSTLIIRLCLLNCTRIQHRATLLHSSIHEITIINLFKNLSEAVTSISIRTFSQNKQSHILASRNSGRSITFADKPH
jgi:hypothetical protein